MSERLLSTQNLSFSRIVLHQRIQSSSFQTDYYKILNEELTNQKRYEEDGKVALVTEPDATGKIGHKVSRGLFQFPLILLIWYHLVVVLGNSWHPRSSSESADRRKLDFGHDLR